MPRLAWCALLLFSAAAVVFAQTPTGTITGRVIAPDGQPLPGVTVTAVGAASTAPRVTTTLANGEYTITSLPPGRYTLTFEHAGMHRMTRTVELHIADTARLDTAMLGEMS